MGPLLPYLLIAWLVSLIAVGSGAWIKATSVEKAHCQVRIATLETESVQRQQAELGTAIVAATKTEKSHAKARERERAIDRRVDAITATPAAQRVCLEPDGLSDLNAVIVGTVADPAKPDPGMPPAPAP